MFEATEGRWGSREIEIFDVTFLDAAGEPSHVFHSGDRMSIRLKVRTSKPADDFVFGIASSTPTASAATAPTRCSRK
jgi:hypothetical protein